MSSNNTVPSNRALPWAQELSLIFISMVVGVLIAFIAFSIVNNVYGFVPAHPYTKLLVVGVSLTNFITIYIITGFWHASPRRNRFDQRHHLTGIAQKSLRSRTLIAILCVFLMTVFGIYLVWANIIPIDPISIGRGNPGPDDMPIHEIEDLKNAIQTTVHLSALSLDVQSRNDLLILYESLDTYEHDYAAKTPRDWSTAKDLMTQIEEVEEKLPDMDEHLWPELNRAKGSLVYYMAMNEPFTNARSPIIFEPMVLLWVLAVGGTGFFSAAFANRFTHARQTHTLVNAAVTDRNDIQTAVSRQLRNRPANPYLNRLHFSRCRPRPDNKGYFFTVKVFNRPASQPLQNNDRPVQCLLFTINNLGEIEEPIFEVNMLLGLRRQTINPAAHDRLIRTISTKINDAELRALSHELEIPEEVLSAPDHRQQTGKIIAWLLENGRICELIEKLQQIYPRENWLGG